MFYFLLHDFCLDWQMNVVSKKELCREFVQNKWDFTSFEVEAKKRNWFVKSMYALLYAEDFAG